MNVDSTKYMPEAKLQNHVIQLQKPAYIGMPAQPHQIVDLNALPFGTGVETTSYDSMSNGLNYSDMKPRGHSLTDKQLVYQKAGFRLDRSIAASVSPE